MKAPTIRAIPPAVANALREVHGLVVHRSPYNEVATALAAAASLPDAAGPEVTELIALERLEAVERYPAAAISDDDIERVLQVTEDQRAAMPPDQRDWLLQRACWNRPALVLRHLVPRLAELEQSAHEDAETLESLRRQISIARGEPQPPIEQDEEPEEESNGTFPEDFIEGIRYAYHHQKMGWPYEDVAAILDEVATLPSAAAFPEQLMRDHLVLTSIYQLPDDQIAREIERALQVLADEPVKYRAPTILIACMDRVGLIERYVPPLVAELEEELRRDPGDSEVADNLAWLRGSLERTRAGG